MGKGLGAVWEISDKDTLYLEPFEVDFGGREREVRLLGLKMREMVISVLILSN